MINIKDNFFQIDTLNTSYLIRVNKYNYLEQLHYGDKINFEDRANLVETKSVLLVNTLYIADDATYCIDGINYDYSFGNCGDIRSSSFVATNNGQQNYKFEYK